jgi:hypothetical protein
LTCEHAAEDVNLFEVGGVMVDVVGRARCAVHCGVTEAACIGKSGLAQRDLEIAALRTENEQLKRR